MKHKDLGLACDDCVIAIANDDYSGMPEDQAQATRDGIARIGEHLVVGDEVGFSWRQCIVCLSYLGGSRHKVGYLK